MTYPRGIAYHEAGHAVVGWALGLRVTVSRVFYDDAKGWKGETKIDDAAIYRCPNRSRFPPLAIPPNRSLSAEPKDRLVYLVLAECRLILSEAQAPQPDHDVHDGGHNGLPLVIV